MWSYQHVVQTGVAPERVWQLWADLPSWPSWNAGIERIEVDGPFAVGTRFTMTPPGDDPVTLRLVAIEPGRSFSDQLDAEGFTVRTEHRLDPADGGGTRISYRTEIAGSAADEVGPQLGPAITADFPDVLAALVALAER